MSEATTGSRGRIVVGVDGSPSSREAVRWAAGEAERHDAELEAIYAYVPPLPAAVVNAPTNPLIAAPEIPPENLAKQAEQKLEAVLEEVFGERRPARLTSRVVASPPAAALISESLDADQLVVGSRGHGGFRGLLLGSVSEQVVRHARGTVTVVRSPER